MKFVNAVLILIALVHNGWAGYIPDLMDWGLDVINKQASIAFISKNGFKRISPFKYKAIKNNGNTEIIIGVNDEKTITSVYFSFDCYEKCEYYISDVYNYMDEYDVAPQRQSIGGKQAYLYYIRHNNLRLGVFVQDVTFAGFTIYIAK